jgi:hypothetical protein
MKRLKQVFSIVIGGFLCFSTAVYADAVSAKKVVDFSQKYMESLDKYVFDAMVIDEVKTETAKESESYKVMAKVDRPDRLYMKIQGKKKDRSSYLNQGKFTLVDHKFHYYGQLKTPKTIDKALDFIFDKYGINPPLSALIYSDMKQRIKFNKSKYFGTKKVNGVLCDYVAFQNREVELHLWIEKGKKPLLRSFVLFDRTSTDMLKTAANITWDTDPHFSDNTFVFTPSKEMKRISIEPVGR